MCEYCIAARKCVNGDYGNGKERRKNIENRGLCYTCVQNIVNYLVGTDVRHECPGHCLMGYCERAIRMLES